MIMNDVAWKDPTPFSQKLLSLVFGIILLLSFKVHADIVPVIIKTEYKPGSWQPLPSDKIKQAAAFTALQEISASKRFAFFKHKQEDIRYGYLLINIHLVEAAQTATVNISLSLPDQATLFSTHSESLKDHYYDAIYKKFQLAGTIAGQNLVNKYLEDAPSTDKIYGNKNITQTIKQLSDRITQINDLIIKQNIEDDDPKYELRLSYLLTQFNQVNIALENQDSKLDSLIDEINMMNNKFDQQPAAQVNINQKFILQNPSTGKSYIPSPSQKGIDEEKAQKLYNNAQQAKRNSDYIGAKKLLNQAYKLRISDELKTLIADELFYHLPMFEAQAQQIELGSNFQQYASNNRHLEMLRHIRSLYEEALAKNQHDFQRVTIIQSALDQHINSSRAMNSVLAFQNKANFTIVRLQMKEARMMLGRYPDKDEFEVYLQQMRISYQLISYQADEDSYQAKLKSPAGKVITIMGGDNHFDVVD